MIQLNIQDESSRLKAVVLGDASSNGPAPTIDKAYDPKSKEHILAGTYPTNENMLLEMEAFKQVLEKHDVKVYRPETLENYNQIFSRDIAFVIDDCIVLSNILPEREREIEAIQYILDKVDEENIIIPPEEVHVEGGDVMVWNEFLFVGTYTGLDYPDYKTARTNEHAVKFLEKTFPNKIVKSFELRKSNENARENALHLDCCFQPLGKDLAILHPNGFLVEEEYQWLHDYFGAGNVFIIDKEEMYHMNSNIFSIAPDVVVSERNFTRLNAWMRSKGITVEEIPYAEIAKQEGLLRCSTLPLYREPKTI